MIALQRLSIVFVHGLNPSNNPDHAWDTWTHTDTGTFWPLLLQAEIPHARIMIFDYNSRVTRDVSDTTIREHADVLLEELDGKREQKHEMHRPLLFVAHSLGGLVVKQAIINTKLSTRFQALHKSTYSIMFFSTPHKDSDKANYAKMVAGILSFFTGEPRNKELMDSLCKDSFFSTQSRDDFRRMVEKLKVVSFFETKPTELKQARGLFSMRRAFSGVSRTQRLRLLTLWSISNKRLQFIVDKESSFVGLSDAQEVRLPIQADHRNVCKFSSGSDQGYKLAAKHLRKLAKEAVSRQSAKLRSRGGERNEEVVGVATRMGSKLLNDLLISSIGSTLPAITNWAWQKCR